MAGQIVLIVTNAVMEFDGSLKVTYNATRDNGGEINSVVGKELIFGGLPSAANANQAIKNDALSTLDEEEESADVLMFGKAF